MLWPEALCCDVPCAVLRIPQVDVRRCIKVDERRFPADHFDLSGNGCVSLYDNIMSLTSVSKE
jgi:hypothetical protein